MSTPTDTPLDRVAAWHGVTIEPSNVIDLTGANVVAFAQAAPDADGTLPALRLTTFLTVAGDLALITPPAAGGQWRAMLGHDGTVTAAIVYPTQEVPA